MKLKHSVVALVVVALVGVCGLFGEPAATSIPTTVQKVLAAPDPGSAVAWATNVAYSQGGLVKANSRYFMCLIAGTSTNISTNAPYALGDSTDGTVTWRSVMGHTRRGLTVCNDSPAASGGPIYVSFSAPVVAGRGSRLNAGGGSITISGTASEQCSVWAISSAGYTNLLSTDEW